MISSWGGPGAVTVTGGSYEKDPTANGVDIKGDVKVNENGFFDVVMTNTNLKDLISNAQSGDTIILPAGAPAPAPRGRCNSGQ